MLILKGSLLSKFTVENKEKGTKHTMLQFLETGDNGKTTLIDIKDESSKFASAEVGKEINVPITISTFNGKLYYKAIVNNK